MQDLTVTAQKGSEQSLCWSQGDVGKSQWKALQCSLAMGWRLLTPSLSAKELAL